MTVYANLVNGEVKGVYDLLPKEWNGNDNFDLKCKVDENFMRENEFVKIIRDTTPFDATTHKMSDYRDILEIPQPSTEETIEKNQTPAEEPLQE